MNNTTGILINNILITFGLSKMNNTILILIDNLLITLFYEDAVSHVKQVAAGIK